MKFITRSAEETVALAEKIGKLLKGGEIIAYRGGLGAGKTTFTRGLAIGFGAGDVATSPTFTIVNEYAAGDKRLCHFDMYRISGEADLETTGFYDQMTEDAVIAVEWSENIEFALPDGTIYIEFTPLGEEVREIEITGDDRFDNIGD